MLQAAVHPYDTIKNLPNVLIDGIKSFYSTVTHPEEHKLSDVAEAIGAALFPTPIEGLGGLAALATGKVAGTAAVKAAGEVAAKTFTAGAKVAENVASKAVTAGSKAAITAQRAGEALQKLHDTAKLHSDKVLQDITQTLSQALNVNPNYALQMALPTGSLGSQETNLLFNKIPTETSKEENNLYSTIGNTPNHEAPSQTTQEAPHKHEGENKKPSSENNKSQPKKKKKKKKRAEYEELIPDKLPKHIKPIYDKINDGLKENEVRVTGIIDGKEITDYNQKRRASLAKKGEYPPYNPEQETLIGREIKNKNKASLLKAQRNGREPYILPNDTLGTSHAEIGVLEQIRALGIPTKGKEIIFVIGGVEMCSHCAGHLPKILREMEFKKATFYDKRGKVIIHWEPSITTLKVKD